MPPPDLSDACMAREGLLQICRRKLCRLVHVIRSFLSLPSSPHMPLSLFLCLLPAPPPPFLGGRDRDFYVAQQRGRVRSMVQPPSVPVHSRMMLGVHLAPGDASHSSVLRGIVLQEALSQHGIGWWEREGFGGHCPSKLQCSLALHTPAWR